MRPNGCFAGQENDLSIAPNPFDKLTIQPTKTLPLFFGITYVTLRPDLGNFLKEIELIWIRIGSGRKKACRNISVQSNGLF